jgi:hypothetical protein
MRFEVVPEDLQLSSVAALRVFDALRALPAASRFDDGAGLVAGGRLSEAMVDASDAIAAALRQIAVATEHVATRLDAAAVGYTRSDALAMRGGR